MPEHSNDPVLPDAASSPHAPRGGGEEAGGLPELAAKARGATEAFTEHISAPPATDDLGEALEVWALHAVELSRLAADAISAHAQRSHELGRITAAELADRVATVQAVHAGNQEIVRRGLAEAARARAEFDGNGGP
jgi:hypothetical protein